MDRKSVTGCLFALMTFFSWGLLPLYWKAIDHIDPFTIVAHRIVWSFIFLIIVCSISNRLKKIKNLFADYRSLSFSLLSAALIAANWGIYIYAVNTERVTEAALGYYINPLLSVLLGVIFLKEKLNALQKSAFACATFGVLIFSTEVGQLPWLSLGLAGTLGLYGLCKKKKDVADSIVLLTSETILLLVPATLFLVLFDPQWNMPKSENLSSWVLLVGTGVVTALPLVWFSAAAKRIRLSTLGFFQYIGPTCNLLLATKVYGEPFTATSMWTFSFVWLGLILYTIGSYISLTQKKTAEQAIRDDLSHQQVPWLEELIASTPKKPSAPFISVDHILIDNDDLTCLVWKQSAKTHQKSLDTFQSVKDFIQSIPRLNRNVHLFIDQHLENGLKGQYLASILKNKFGFEKVVIQTGDEFLINSNMAVSKTPPWSSHA